MDLLINWMWQGCAVAVATAAILAVMTRTRAQARCVVCWLALVAVVLLPVLPAGITATSTALPAAVQNDAPLFTVEASWWTSATAVALAAALWCAFSLTRLERDLVAARRVRAGCTAFPADFEARLRHWTDARTQGRRACLVISPHVRAASVIGGGRPMIAVAPALVNRLTPDALDRVVIHEWAHVQRRDDLASLAQAVVRLIAGWHPAAWWIERRLLVEREIACDEMAVALTGSAKSYAACLTTVASFRASGMEPANAVGVLSTSALRRRVVRILSRQPLASPAMSAAAAVAAILTVSGLALAIAGYPAVRLAPPVRAAISAAGLPAENGIRQGTMGSNRHTTASRWTRDRDRPAATDASGAMQSADGLHAPSAGELSSGNLVQAAAAPQASTPALPPSTTDPQRSGRIEPGPLQPLPARTTTPTIDHRPALTRPSLGGMPAQPQSPWGTVADAGVAVARGSQQAGEGTGRFFTRLGKKVAGSF